MVSDFTFEARLDDKPVAQGRAKTKKDAKTYAAWFALEALEKESSVYKQEINRIKQGIPSVKKQMRSFTKRKWRGKFNSNNTRQSSYSGANTSFMYSPAAIVVPQISPATVSLTTYATQQTAAPSFVSAQKNPTTTQNYNVSQPQQQTLSKPASKLEPPAISYSSYDTSTNTNNNSGSGAGNSNTSTFPSSSSNNNTYSGSTTQVSTSYPTYTAATSTSTTTPAYYTPTESTFSTNSANLHRQQQQTSSFRNYNNTFSYTNTNTYNQTQNSVNNYYHNPYS